LLYIGLDMDWFNRHPEDLIERSEPSEALAFLRQQAALDEKQLAKLDIYLHHWVLLLMLRPQDPEGLLEILTLCEIALDLTPPSAAGRAMQQRWKAFADLLEGKRRGMQAHTMALPIKLLHEDSILQFIRDTPEGCLKQIDIAKRLQLSAGRISQILGVMEARRLITRKRKGKDSWVGIAAPDGSSNAPTAPKSAPAEQHMGLKVFSPLKAAA
jgi:hypothetical protein